MGTLGRLLGAGGVEESTSFTAGIRTTAAMASSGGSDNILRFYRKDNDEGRGYSS